MKRHFLDNKFEYFTKGSKPRLLLHAGTHGDEYESIDYVTEAIIKYEDLLPSFIYVPHVSPSAVDSKTRKNINDKDLNRVFFDESSEQEVIWNKQVMTGNKFDLAVTFHEDPEFREYYIYDEGKDLVPTKLVLDHNKYLHNNFVELLTGYDDPKDPDLAIHFTDGYKRFELENDHESGMVTTWALHKGIIEHILVPEVPGQFNLKMKKFVVDSFFRKVILKYFKNK